MTQPPDRTGKTGSDELARAVRERREELGLTRQEFADATGIPYPTIAQIETAYRGVSPARLGVIARVLGLDPKDLYEVLASEGESSAEPMKAAGTSKLPGSTELAGFAEAAGSTEPAGTPRGPRLPARTRAMSANRGMPAAVAAPPGGSGGPWHANPQFAAALPAPAAPAPAAPAPAAPTPAGIASRHPGVRTRKSGSLSPRKHQVIDQVVGLLVGLPVDERLPALGDIQQRILDQTVVDRLARGE